MQVTAFDLAQRFIGTKEVAGPVSNAHILAMLRLDNSWVEGDEIPWCSALVNYICWLLRLPRSKSLAARSWLGVGIPIALEQARPGYDVVVLKHAGDHEPGAEIMAAPGHVGFFAGLEARPRATFGDPDTGRVLVLGGNQGDQVCVAPFPVTRVLGVRRLYVEQSA